MAVALVSTVDSMPDEFPSHCVIVFESARKAVTFAVEQIVKHDPRVDYVGDEKWCFDGEVFGDPFKLLSRWQETVLDGVEYFHLKTVCCREQFDVTV